MTLLLQRVSRLLISSVKPSVNPSYRLNFRRYKHSYEGDGKLTATILNLDLDLGLMIDSISVAGFRLNNGTVALGPLALFHRSVLSWKITNAANIDAEALSLFKVLEPKIDFLIIGLGDPEDVVKYSPHVVKLCKEINVNVEVLPTESACSTFNFLNSEGRHVAALLIPPTKLKISEDDIMASSRRLEEYRTTKEKREKELV